MIPRLWLIGPIFSLLAIGPSHAQPVFGTSPAPQPYPYVGGGAFSGSAFPHSPDPLVAYRWPKPGAEDGLEVYLQRPVALIVDSAGSFGNAQSLMSPAPNVVVKGTGSIRVDFGRENAAWLEFDSPDLTGTVEMSISEYAEPGIVNSGPPHPVKTAAPKRYGNTYRLELNPELYEGVRFGWIHVRTFASPWQITGIRLVCQVKPTNYNGGFASSDTMLTRIWYTGAYGVKVNLVKDYFGAVLMDRGDRFSWTGDAHPAQAASLVAFGNFDFVRKNLDFTSAQSNGILSYELLWVLSLVDYFNYTGDTATLSKYVANAGAKLETAYKIHGTNPLLAFYGHDERIGAAFERPNRSETQNAYKMLSIRAWREFSGAMGALGRTDLRDKYAGYADAKMADLRRNPSWYAGFGLHAGADAATTGLLTAREKEALFNQNFADRVNRNSFSPFNQYFVIQAMAAMGRYDEALGSVQDVWGGQIRYGGTTFFETWRASWLDYIPRNGAVPNNQTGYTSLCHAWGGGVTKWLSEEILGIKPASPGFRTYDILPHLGRTLTRVSGHTPTPLGEIRASFDLAAGAAQVSAPAGTVGRIGIPKAERMIRSITANGALAWDGGFHPVPGLGAASEDSQYVYFTSVQPGTYAFTMEYTGTTPAYEDPEPVYPARFLGTDSATSGDWGGKFGKEGSVLFNYEGKGSHKQNLPSYVTSIDRFMLGGFNLPHDGVGEPLNYVFASGTSDRRAPAPDQGNGMNRTAAALYTANPEACRQSFTLTVNVAGRREYQIALYFLDWDDQGRRAAVEMFDAATLNLIAPDQAVSHFRGGKYLVFSYDRSVKFRINHIRGVNAVLSGIFFDPAPATGIRSGPASGMVVKLSGYERKADLAFSIDAPKSALEAELLDLRGRKVAVLAEGTFAAGRHKVSVVLPSLPHGVYVLRIRLAGRGTVRKVEWRPNGGARGRSGPG